MTRARSTRRVWETTSAGTSRRTGSRLSTPRASRSESRHRSAPESSASGAETSATSAWVSMTRRSGRACPATSGVRSRWPRTTAVSSCGTRGTAGSTGPRTEACGADPPAAGFHCVLGNVLARVPSEVAHGLGDFTVSLWIRPSKPGAYTLLSGANAATGDAPTWPTGCNRRVSTFRPTAAAHTAGGSDRSDLPSAGCRSS